MDQIFPDDAVLTPAQRGVVNSAIDREMTFGLLLTKMAEFLDAAQSMKDGPASRIWKEVVERNVKRLGGYRENDPVVRPEDEVTMRAMFNQVRKWVSNEYVGYPVDVAAIFPLFEFKTTTKNNASTNIGHRERRVRNWDRAKPDGVLQPPPP